MKRAILYNVYLSTLLACLLCGCGAEAGRHEMEDVFLVEVLGVDWGRDNVALTAADAERILRADGGTAQRSHQRLKEGGEGYVALTHVEHIVAGAQGDLRAVLEGALQGNEVGQTATIWISVDTTARELLEQAGGGAKRLEAIKNNTRDFHPVTVMEALVSLEETGTVVLPAVNMEDGKLTLAGERIWKEKT